MDKIPTAKEILNKYNNTSSGREVAMIEFAKLHVQRALEIASENAELEYEPSYRGDGEDNAYVDRKSILNAYPLENIK